MSAFDDYLKTKPEHWRGGYTESALEDCWNAAIKSVEVAPSASNNSQFVLCNIQIPFCILKLH